MKASTLQDWRDCVRDRGVLIPVTITQDLTVLTGAAVFVLLLHYALASNRRTSLSDKIVLASSSAIIWYAGRYVLFGTRWGTTNAIWMTDKLWPLTPSRQWETCPYKDPSWCSLESVPIAQATQGLENLQPNDPATLHFSAVFHYIRTFVEKQSLALFVHLAFIAIAGVLWPLQVWGSFRHESYARHKLLGKIVMACMLGAYVPAAQIAYFHLNGETWAQKVTGLGFTLNITASVYSLTMGVIAAKQKDITMHRQHVVSMVGLAYGVFPFKYVWIFLLAVTNVLSGDWLYGVSVWCSTITGLLVTRWAFLGKLPAKDAAYDRHGSKNDTESDKNQ